MKKLKLVTKTKMTDKQRIDLKIVLLFILIAIFVSDLIYIGFFKNDTKTSVKEDNSVLGLSSSENPQTNAEVDVPNFGTDVIIKKFDEQVVRMLGDNSDLVERAILKYIQTSLDDISEAEIFYATASDDEDVSLTFFCKFVGTDEIISVVFDYGTESVSVVECDYTEKEILSEVWQGDAPAIRDVEE